jgi:hypothetical protein
MRRCGVNRHMPRVLAPTLSTHGFEVIACDAIDDVTQVLVAFLSENSRSPE